MEKAHSMRDIVSQISRSATIMPGQIRRLDNVGELVFLSCERREGKIEGGRGREGEKEEGIYPAPNIQ